MDHKVVPGLESLGAPPATAKLAIYFARNGTARPTVRELQRTLGVASASVQRDLDRLIHAGALVARTDGRLIRYVTRPESPVWHAVRLLIGDAAPAGVLRAAVRENAVRYGVDLGQLRSMLRLSIEERLSQLDANAAFLIAARSSRTASRRRR